MGRLQWNCKIEHFFVLLSLFWWVQSSRSATRQHIYFRWIPLPSSSALSCWDLSSGSSSLQSDPQSSWWWWCTRSGRGQKVVAEAVSRESSSIIHICATFCFLWGSWAREGAYERNKEGKSCVSYRLESPPEAKPSSYNSERSIVRRRRPKKRKKEEALVAGGE